MNKRSRFPLIFRGFIHLRRIKFKPRHWRYASLYAKIGQKDRLYTRSQLKNRILAQDQGGVEFQSADILKYFEELRGEPNTEIVAKDIFEMASRLIVAISLATLIITTSPSDVGSQDAQALVEAGFHYMRDRASISVVDMTIHRPEWQRVFTIKAWTLGDKDSLLTIIAPAKDRGNGTLKKGKQMWMYNPKINRVIKLPPSLMSQAWMGSDFSNNDLAKSDSVVNEYRHSIIGTTIHKGKKVYFIQSIPEPKAPVVWGMQRLKIREDNIFLEQAFYDEDMKVVKILKFLDIQMLGGKPYPKKMIMEKTEEKDNFTTVEYKTLVFKKNLPAGLFTLSNLKKPKR